MAHILANDLKEAVLYEAFQGKLTQRLCTDSDVNELVSIIKEEKERLFKNKKIAKQKALLEINEEELPFEIPKEWKWQRWGNLSNSIQYGANAGAVSTGDVKLVRISDIQNNKVVWESVPFCSLSKEEATQYKLNENDILFARTGGTVGKSVIVKDIPDDGYLYIYAGYLIRSNYNSNINYRFLKYFMESKLYWDQLKEGTIGSAQPNCNGNTLSKMLIPIPSPEEADRIVARVDELMAMIDEYEKLENQLVELKRDFPGDMKDAILQAAMQGKLTEQCENDNPVTSILIERGIKECEEDIYEIPPYWKWIKACDISDIVVGATPSTANHSYYENGTIYWLPSGCCQDCDIYKETAPYKLITKAAYDSCSTKMMPADTAVIALTGATAGKVGLLHFEACGNQSVVGILPSDIMLPKFIYYYLMSRRTSILADCVGSAQPHISKDYITKMSFPLPPIEEQNRIIEKLEQLLPLCESLM